MDKLTPEHRSWNMRRIRSKNTKPEVIVRSLLHKLGFRFRLHVKNLPGKPDIVLPKYQTVVFVHGCFWHRHRGCKSAATPGTRPDFWKKKFEDNIRRDKQVRTELRELGWNVIVVWQCELSDLDAVARKLKAEINGSQNCSGRQGPLHGLEQS